MEGKLYTRQNPISGQTPFSHPFLLSENNQTARNFNNVTMSIVPYFRGKVKPTKLPQPNKNCGLTKKSYSTHEGTRSQKVEIITHKIHKNSQ